MPSQSPRLEPYVCAVLPLLLLLTALGRVLSDPECGGHGLLDGDKCKCTSPLPQTTGEAGFIGDQCTQVVYSVMLNGQDVQATCSQGVTCNTAAPGAPACFASGIAELFDTDYHLSISLTSASPAAPLTLKGMLSAFKDVTNLDTNVTTTTTEVYPNSQSHIDFTAFTSASGSLTLNFNRRQLGFGAMNGLYICVESPVSITTFTMRAASHACPLRIMGDANLELCNGHAAADTCPNGVCTCAAPYAPPSPAIYPGLGFDDCSAPLNDLAATTPGTATDQPSGKWAFWRIQISAATFEYVLSANTAKASDSSLQLFIAREKLPGSSPGWHELSSCIMEWADTQQTSLRLRSGDEHYAPGVWYIGALNSGPEPVSYILVLSENTCPGGCSGRGACDAGLHTCACTGDGVSGSDCSSHALTLTAGTAMESEVIGTDILTLPGADTLLSAPSAQLLLTASFTIDRALPEHVHTRPVLLVAPAGWDASTGSLSTEVSALQLHMTAPGTDYTAEVGPWLLSNGSIVMVLSKPSGFSGKLTSKVMLTSEAPCLSDCSGHGTCANGICQCTANFTGGDCSVDMSQLKPASACVSGSAQPARREEQHATCWMPCKDDQSGYDTTACSAFACDATGPAGERLRRKGDTEECVSDLCQPGSVSNVTLEDGSAMCSRRWDCPEDGGACSLSASCIAGSTQCLNGLHLIADRCIAVSCQEGSLQLAQPVDGGAGYTLCTCADTGECAYSTQEPVVVCSSGFVLKDINWTPKVLHDGKKVYTGGICVREPRKGVSGGMVFFYCLLSIGLAGGSFMLSKHGVMIYEHLRYSSLPATSTMWQALLGRRGGDTPDDW